MAERKYAIELNVTHEEFDLSVETDDFDLDICGKTPVVQRLLPKLLPSLIELLAPQPDAPE